MKKLFFIIIFIILNINTSQLSLSQEQEIKHIEEDKKAPSKKALDLFTLKTDIFPGQTVIFDGLYSTTSLIIDRTTVLSKPDFITCYNNRFEPSVELDLLIKANKNPTEGKYSIIIKVNSHGLYSGKNYVDTIIVELTVKPYTKVIAPKLSSPGNQQNSVMTSITVYWEPSLAASEYILQIATDSLFTILIENSKHAGWDRWVKINNLNYTTKYYWRVKAYNDIDTSAWSEVYSFFTKPSAKPVQFSPAEGASDILTTVNLFISPLPEFTKYIFELSDNNFSSVLISKESPDTSALMTDLFATKKYYWRVKGYHSVYGWSDYSTVRTFSTKNIQVTNVPTPSQPANDEKNLPLSINFYWWAFSGATKYTFQISDTSNFSRVLLQNQLYTPSCQIYGLSYNKLYYWRIKVSSGSTTTNWSDTWSFQTMDYPVISSPPVLQFPPEKGEEIACDPTLIWKQMPSATKYSLELSLNSDFTKKILSIDSSNFLSYKVDSLFASTIYYWRVRASNPKGSGIWSPANTFKTSQKMQYKVIMKPNDYMINSFSLSPDEKKLAITQQKSWFGNELIIDIAKPNSTKYLNNIISQAIQYSPDGSKIAIGGDNKSLEIRDATSGNTLQNLPGHTATITSICFTPDGSKIISAGWDNVIIWNLNDGSILKKIYSTYSTTNSISISPDGSKIALGGGGSYFCIRDMNTYEMLSYYSGHNETINWVTFSPDGKKVATAGSDSCIVIRSVETGNQIQKISGFSGKVMVIAYSPDGTRIAAGCDDQIITIWDAETGKLLNSLSAHSAPITALKYFKSGTELISGSQDGSTKIWNLSTPNTIPTNNPEKIREYRLSQNYPNPFNPSTVISYQLSANSKVTLKIYDILGREVHTLINEYKPAGEHNVTFDAKDLSGGVYFYKIEVGNFTEIKKMIFLK